MIWVRATHDDGGDNDASSLARVVHPALLRVNDYCCKCHDSHDGDDLYNTKKFPAETLELENRIGLH